MNYFAPSNSEPNPFELGGGGGENPQATPKANNHRERVPVMTGSAASNAMNNGIGIQGVKGPSPLRQETGGEDLGRS